MGKWCLRASSFIFDWIVIKVAVNQDRHKARMSSIWGLWFPWPIYMFFEMRFRYWLFCQSTRTWSNRMRNLRGTDVIWSTVATQYVEGWRIIVEHFLTWKKIEFFNFWIGAHLAHKINPIKFYKEWWNLNTIKISFCKVAVPRVKFMIKEVKMTTKRKKMATLPRFSAL